MAVIDPAVQWLFWLLLCPLAYTASWVPQWRLDWRRWYNADVEWPFVAPALWWGGAQTTLFYACSYAGAFLLWRLDQAALGEHDATMYTTALALYVAGSMLYSINQIPLFYWALPWQTLAIVAVAAAMFSSAAGLTCAIDADQYPAACVLRLAVARGWIQYASGVRAPTAGFKRAARPFVGLTAGRGAQRGRESAADSKGGAAAQRRRFVLK